LTWHVAASVRMKLEVPATQWHHREHAAPLAGSLFHKFGFFMDCLRTACRGHCIKNLKKIQTANEFCEWMHRGVAEDAQFLGMTVRTE